MKAKMIRPILLAQLIWLAAAPGVAQEKSDENVRRVERFQGSAKVGTKTANVSVQRYAIPGKQTVTLSLPPGFHVLTLRAGKLAAPAGGQGAVIESGHVWTAKDGEKVTVTARGETALVEVMTLVIR